MPKLLTVESNGKTHSFIFCDFFTEESIRTGVKSIRIGFRDWKREFMNIEGQYVEAQAYKPLEKMKYIVCHDEKDKDNGRFMVVFSSYVDHNRMFEGIQNAAYDTVKSLGSECNIMPVSVFSAGFVYPDGTCAGSSETLATCSNKGDTALYRNQFIKELGGR